MLSEVVLEVGAEGGSLTLLRERRADDEDWQFRIQTDETTLYEFCDDIELADLVQTTYAHSFDEALSFLDKYPWAELHPIQVHSQFIEAVLLAVNKRTDANTERRWRDTLKL